MPKHLTTTLRNYDTAVRRNSKHVARAQSIGQTADASARRRVSELAFSLRGSDICWVGSTRELTTSTFGFRVPFTAPQSQVASRVAPMGLHTLASAVTSHTDTSISRDDRPCVDRDAPRKVVSSAPQVMPDLGTGVKRKRARSSVDATWFRRSKKIKAEAGPEREKVHAKDGPASGRATLNRAIVLPASLAIVADEAGIIAGNMEPIETQPLMKERRPPFEDLTGSLGTDSQCEAVVAEKQKHTSRPKTKPQRSAQPRTLCETEPINKEHVSAGLGTGRHSRDASCDGRPASKTIARHADPAEVLARSAAPLPLLNCDKPSSRPRRCAAHEASKRAAAIVALEAADEAADRREAKRRQKPRGRIRKGANGKVAVSCNGPDDAGGRTSTRSRRMREPRLKVTELVEGVLKVEEGDSCRLVGRGKENAFESEQVARQQAKAPRMTQVPARKQRKAGLRKALQTRDVNV